MPGSTAPSASAASTESAAPAQTGRPAGRPSACARSGRSGLVSADGTTGGRPGRPARPPAGATPATAARCGSQAPRLEPVAAVPGRRARVGQHVTGEPREQVVLGAEQGRRPRGPRRVVSLHPREHRQQVAAVERLPGLLVDLPLAGLPDDLPGLGVGATVLPGQRRSDGQAGVVQGDDRGDHPREPDRPPALGRGPRRRASRAPPSPPPSSSRGPARRGRDPGARSRTAPGRRRTRARRRRAPRP